METNTIIILSFSAFIIGFCFIFMYIVNKGKKNAKKSYHYCYKFDSKTPYMNQTEMHYHLCDLIDKALKDEVNISGIGFYLITDNDNKNKF